MRPLLGPVLRGTVAAHMLRFYLLDSAGLSSRRRPSEAWLSPIEAGDAG